MNTFLNRIESKLKGRDLNKQILLLEEFLSSSRDCDEIIVLGKLLREKELQARSALAPKPPEPPDIPKPTRQYHRPIIVLPKVEPSKPSLEGLLQKIQIFVISGEWDNAKSVIQQINSGDYQLNDEQITKFKEALESIKEHEKKLTAPRLKPSQIYLQRLRVLIADESSLPEARSLANKIMNDYEVLSPDEIERFRELLFKLRELETAQDSKKNLLAELETMRQERDAFIQKYQALSSVYESNQTEMSSLLSKLSILISDLSIGEAREVANYLKQHHYGSFTPDQLEYFKKLLSELKVQETAKEQQCDLSLRVKDLEKEKISLLTQLKKYGSENDDLKKERDSQRAIPKQVEKLKKLIATIIAHVYVKNREALLPEKRIAFNIDQYSKGSPRGFNPALPGSVREVILQHFEETISQYEKLADAD